MVEERQLKEEQERALVISEETDALKVNVKLYFSTCIM